MIGICIFTIFVIAIFWYSFRKYKDIKEQSLIIDECVNSLEEALEARYKCMEDLIDFSGDYLEDESRFVVKLVQARLLPVEEKLMVEEEFVSELQKLLLYIADVPELYDTQEYESIMVRLSKAEKIIFEECMNLNRLASAYNKNISKIPTNIIAKLGGFKERCGFDTEYVVKKHRVSQAA